MKNDIYDLLNDIDNQIDTFENIDITSTDLNKKLEAVLYFKEKSIPQKAYMEKIRCRCSRFCPHSRRKQCHGKTERIRTITADYGEVIHTFRC